MNFIQNLVNFKMLYVFKDYQKVLQITISTNFFFMEEIEGLDILKSIFNNHRTTLLENLIDVSGFQK